LFQIEDALEDDKKELNSKIESLESIVRMLELKSKNASDHGKYSFCTDYYS
jgi:JNK_SAPK-associated protein-1.